MKRRRAGRVRAAFTLTELLVGLVILIVLALVALPVGRPSRKSSRIKCVNNLKNIGLSFRISATDTGGKFPMELSTNLGGSLEFVDAPFSAYRHFQTLSNELSTPNILLCPEDKGRVAVTNFAPFSNRNLSYFINLDAGKANPGMFLAGDRWIDSDQKATNGILTLTGLSNPYWTNEDKHGVVCLLDGSVQYFSNSRLKDALRAMPTLTNRLARPD